MTARLARRAALVICLLVATACQSSAKDGLPALMASSTAVARETRLERALHDTGARDDSAPLARWLLPKELKEISGLALSSDGKLFTHGDELGQIWEIDYRRA